MVHVNQNCDVKKEESKEEKGKEEKEKVSQIKKLQRVLSACEPTANTAQIRHCSVSGFLTINRFVK